MRLPAENGAEIVLGAVAGLCSGCLLGPMVLCQSLPDTAQVLVDVIFVGAALWTLVALRSRPSSPRLVFLMSVLTTMTVVALIALPILALGGGYFLRGGH